jgi:hypothetical protein
MLGPWPSIRMDSWPMFVQRAQAQVGNPPHRLGFLYRGQANFDWNLKPSLARLLPSGTTTSAALALERDSLDEFRVQAHLHVATSRLPRDSGRIPLRDWWAVMQHYRAPTRLLDWTQYPYVAAYYAAESRSKLDGIVFAVDGKRLLDLYKKARGKTGEPTNEEMRDPRAPALVSIWRPERRDERIVAQQGYLTWSLNVMASHEEALTQLTVPGNTSCSS